MSEDKERSRYHRKTSADCSSRQHNSKHSSSSSQHVHSSNIVGKEFSASSGGLFSPLDWICKRCGNINWAKRTTCNICCAKRETIVENRTGACGGYNERESIEYRRNRDHDSDDEYDKYGRKRRPHQQQQLRIGHSEKLVDNRYAADNEDTASSSGEDFDKYDLSSFIGDSDSEITKKTV